MRLVTPVAPIEDSGGQEKCPPNKDCQAIKEGVSRKAAPGQLTLNVQKGPEPLQTGQRCPGESCENHQAHGRPKAHYLSQLNEDEEFQEGDPHKKEGQAREK